MNKPPGPYSAQCKGKQQHETKLVALKIAKRIGVCVYKCPHCKKFHVGREK